MQPPRVISLDLDDTLWPVGPVIASAENALMAWLRERHPVAMQGQDVDSMRALRLSVAARFPDRSHDMTFLRHRALVEQFTAAGYGAAADGVAAHADEALEVFLSAAIG